MAKGIKVIIGNNVRREEVHVNRHVTPRQVLEGKAGWCIHTDILGGKWVTMFDKAYEYDRYIVHLDGNMLSDEDFDKSFEELGVDCGKCFLIVIIKKYVV